MKAGSLTTLLLTTSILSATGVATSRSYSPNLNITAPTAKYRATMPTYYYTGFYDYDPYAHSYVTPSYQSAYRSPYFYTYSAPAYSYWSYGPSFSMGYSSDGTYGSYYW